MKTTGRQKRDMREAIKRLVVSLMVVMLFHGFFVMIVRIRTRHAQAVVREDEERLRLWCMSLDDGNLTPLAQDFLKQLDVLMCLDGRTPRPLGDDGVFELYPGKSMEEREAKKRHAGIRLGWENVTIRLDGELFHAQDYGTLDGVDGGHWMSMGGLALKYDLNASSLWNPLRLGYAQSRDNWKSGVLAEHVWKESGRVWVSKYEDNAWSDVSPGALEERIAAIVPSGAPSSLSATHPGVPCMIWVDVVEGLFHGARVHLRQGSGNDALDGVVLAWVLGRHGQLGHHHTDAALEQKEHVVDYWIEVRP